MKTVRPLRHIRKTFDWQEYVETHYSVKYANSDRELRICCPSCNENKYKLYVNPEKKVFHCFKCDFSCKNQKDVFDFVSITENINRNAAILKLLHEYTPVTPEDMEAALSGELDAVPENIPRFRHDYIESLPKEAIALSSSSPDNPFWKYLKNRGLTDYEIERLLNAHAVFSENCNILNSKGKICGNIGRRVLWPIYGGTHKLVSWQSRCIEDYVKTNKYLNAPETDLSKTLWPYVPPFKNSTVILTEGVLDAIALRRLPREYSGYATFSKHISKHQVELLQTWGVTKIILFWDPDAKKDIKNTTNLLKLYFNVKVPSFTGWEKERDCGSCLASPNGIDYIVQAVKNSIEVDSLDFIRWEID